MSKIGYKIYLALFAGLSILLFVNLSLITYFRNLAVVVINQITVDRSVKNVLNLNTSLHNLLDNQHNKSTQEIEADLNFYFDDLRANLSIIKGTGIYVPDYNNLESEISSLEKRARKNLEFRRVVESKIEKLNQNLNGGNYILDQLGHNKSGKIAELLEELTFETKRFANLNEIDNYSNLTKLAEPISNLLSKEDEQRFAVYLENLRLSRQLKDEIKYTTYEQEYHLNLLEEDVVYINFYSNHIGGQIDARYQELIAFVNKKFLSSIILVILAVYLSIIMLYWVASNIMKPILSLTKVAETAASGDLSKRVDVISHDEIGYLSSVFNDMLTVIDNFQKEAKENEQQLQELNSKLEVKVAARTKELEDIKSNLEKIVAERTAELEQKLNELEKFRDLTVGRELKMIELKKKIQELKYKT